MKEKISEIFKQTFDIDIEPDNMLICASGFDYVTTHVFYKPNSSIMLGSIYKDEEFTLDIRLTNNDRLLRLRKEVNLYKLSNKI